MRLINTQTLELEEFYGRYPQYAILSHTWTDEEVTFQDWQQNLESLKKKKGFVKITSACKKSLHDGYKYLWCDTSCIDKKSSAELSEAINSMFAWYKGSAICYAYLEDVVPGPRQKPQLLNSRWFTRGWTLQELLAPTSVHFFAQDWTFIGTRAELSNEISTTTGIDLKVIQGGSLDLIHNASISERMSWVSHRETTRVEDMAYCMLGIFDINMPLLYGEGHKAFIRLQEEIIRVYNDQTIFCWHWETENVPDNWASVLSPSPRTFVSGANYSPCFRFEVSGAYAMTNAGLQVDLPALKTNWGLALTLAFLNVVSKEAGEGVGILLNSTRRNHYTRSPVLHRPVIFRKDVIAPVRSFYLAGPRETFFHSQVDVPSVSALVMVDTGTGYKALYNRPKPTGSFSALNQLHTERHYGCFVGFLTGQAQEDLQKMGIHTVDQSVLKVIVFFGCQIDHIGDTPSLRCKVLTMEKSAPFIDLEDELGHMRKRLRSDVQFSRSIFPQDVCNDFDLLCSEELGIDASVSLNPTIGGLEESTLIIANIQLRTRDFK